MKKLLNSMLLLLVLCLCIVPFIIKENSNELFTFAKSYNKLYKENFSFSVELFFEKEENHFMDKKRIEEIKIYSNTNINQIQLELEDINSNKCIIKNRNYTKNEYILKFQNLKNDFIVTDANFYLKNNINEVIDIKIGDVSFIYDDYIRAEEVSFFEIYGIFNTYENIKMLNGIYVEFDLSVVSIFIKSIRIADENIYINSNEIKKIENKISNDYSVKDNYSKYQILDKRVEFEETKIEHRDKVLFLINYEYLKFINNSYIIIEYSINNEIKYFVVDNFNFLNLLDYNEIYGSIKYYEY